MEIDHSPTENPTNKKKYGEEAGEKGEQKRKHRVSEPAVPPSTIKKKKHKYRSKPTAAEVSELAPPSTEPSPFHRQTRSLYLPLAPIGQQTPLQSLCAEHLSPLILTYYPPFHGVIISYSNPRLSIDPEGTSTDGRQKVYARSINEYAATFVWITADFLILNPQKGDVCEGYISLQNESSIGLVCWNFFSASIERSRLPKDWTWKSSEKRKSKQKLKRPSQQDEMEVDGEDGVQKELSRDIDDPGGHFEDGEGTEISEIVHFRVRDVDTSSSTSRDFGFMSILGTMLSGEVEQSARQGSALPNGSSRRERQAPVGSMVNGCDGAIDVDSDGAMEVGSGGGTKPFVWY